MKLNISLQTIRLAIPFSLLAFTGCASLFGPYVPEEDLQKWRATTSRNEPTDEQLSEFDSTDATVTTQVLETEQAAETQNPVWDSLTPPVVETPTLPFEPPTPEFPSTQPDTTPPSENPFAEMARQGILQTSARTPVASATARTVTMPGSVAASTFREAEARVPTAANTAPQDCICAPSSPTAKAYPDEYICDGGDRDAPVHYFGGEMQGLDTEDTVAEFKDVDGKNHVQASNKVCVYAPRFGAVRTVSGPGIGVKIDKASGGTDIRGIGALEHNRGLKSGIHHSIASGVGSKSSASGVESSQPAHISEKAEALVQSAKVDQGFESKTSRGLNLLRTTDVHELNLQILEPGKSSTQTRFGMSASTTQATQTYSTFRLQATVGSEKGGRPGKIHITKEASPLVAKAGEIITFTIQFRNVGDYNVSDVRIIDNLTPRLTYVDASGQIDIGDGAGGGLVVVPNKEGSQTLIFELDQPLKGGESGSITFEAKVL